MRRPSFAFASLALIVALGAAPAPVPPAAPGADAIFARAKDVWRARHEANFVSYGLLERYSWRAHTHDNWWHAAYRDADRALVLHRIVVAEEERARLRGAAIGMNFHIHNGSAKVDTLESNRDADAFPVLDPLVDPNASFGLRRHEGPPSLARDAGVSGEPAPGAAPTALPLAAPTPEPSHAAVPGAFATERPLRELARVEAVARDYRISLAGVERVRDVDAYHLTLVPLREPHRNRLRDLWVATDGFATVKLDVDGLFEGRPYEDARWTVTYVPIDGREYVQQIKTDESLRFGADRYVEGLEYDFVEYAFPPTVSPLEFERLL